MESDLFATLQAQCAQVWPTVAPTDTPRPYVTYQQIGGDVLEYLDNPPPMARNAYMQINAWSDDPQVAKDLMRQIEAALLAATAFAASPMAAMQDDHDPDMQVYGARQDFSVWY